MIDWVYDETRIFQGRNALAPVQFERAERRARNYLWDQEAPEKGKMHGGKNAYYTVEPIKINSE